MTVKVHRLWLRFVCAYEEHEPFPHMFAELSPRCAPFRRALNIALSLGTHPLHEPNGLMVFDEYASLQSGARACKRAELTAQ